MCLSGDRDIASLHIIVLHNQARTRRAVKDRGSGMTRLLRALQEADSGDLGVRGVAEGGCKWFLYSTLRCYAECSM